MHAIVDGIPRGVTASPGAFDSIKGLYRGARMTWTNLLTSSTVGSSVCGLFAMAAELPNQVTWSFVFLSLIPCVTLLIRAVYSYGVRRLESRERMEMIARGLALPTVVIPPIGDPEGPDPEKPKGKA